MIITLLYCPSPYIYKSSTVVLSRERGYATKILLLTNESKSKTVWNLNFALTIFDEKLYLSIPKEDLPSLSVLY